MKILSLFDGISCARVALERAGIPVDVYYASEIDKYAKEIAFKNYPATIGLGDIKEIKWDCRQQIDLLIGGSPCQDLSIAKKGREGLSGERSGLFYEYLRILREVKPKYFILENVASMSKEARDEITKEMGVEPIMIDAGLVSSSRRKRLFWTNIPNVYIPSDTCRCFSEDIDTFGIKKYIPDDFKERTLNKTTYKADYYFIDPPYNKKLTAIRARDYKRTSNLIWDIHEKRYRQTTPIEHERVMGLPDNYTEGISNTQRYKCLGNAFNVDVVAHILSFIPKL